jgi:hypothetical protein
MTELDDDLVPETLALIDEFGLDAIFTIDAGTFDDTTSTWTPAPTISIRKVTPPTLERRQSGGGVLVETTISYVAAKDLPFTPAVSMLVSIDGREFRLTNVQAIYSGSLVAIWKLGLD